MDNVQERKENQPKSEVVQLGQNFQLFKPERTSFKNKGKLETRIALHIEGLSMLRFKLELCPSDKNELYPVELTFFPSEPEKGYRVTNEDFDPETRAKKRDMIENQPLFPYSLEYLSFNINFLNSGVLEEGTYDPDFFIQGKPRREFKPEILKVIERLRLRLFFPKAAFEAKPDELNVGHISFGDFYPFDTGPLPKVHKFGSEGEDVSFSTNIEDVQKVNGIFVLAPEESK